MEPRQDLFKRFINNECTRQEIEELLAQFNDAWNESELRQIIAEQLKNKDNKQVAALLDLDKKETVIYEALLTHLQKKQSFQLWPRIAVAASILIGLLVGGYLFSHKKAAQDTTYLAQNDVGPGTNHAILKMGHGKTILLDNSKNGLIAKQGNTIINKTTAGQLAYSALNDENITAMVYDTLVNPAGATVYHLKLADGTRLVLNAATTIRFPESFRGKERKIELLNGEIFGDVVHNAAMPFRVLAAGLLVEDVGTHFNINAYRDEPNKKITLLEGSVKVFVKGSAAILTPGQQAVVGDNGKVQVMKDVDTGEATAWMEGVFRFDSEDLGSIMRKISRWYDVSVIYTDDSVKDLLFGAVTTRFSNVSQVLKMLEKTKEVHFKIEAKKIIVSK